MCVCVCLVCCICILVFCSSVGKSTADALKTPPSKRAFSPATSAPKNAKKEARMNPGASNPGKKSGEMDDDAQVEASENEASVEQGSVHESEPDTRSRTVSKSKDMPPSEEAAEARLRRLCEMKPSGKCNGSASALGPWRVFQG